MPNHVYPLPFATAGQVPIQESFNLVKEFDSREGTVELVSSKRTGKLRIVKSVKHNDRLRAPAEARALCYRALDGKNHPNIVQLLSVELNLQAGFSLMLFEYCSGGDLFEQLKRRRATPLFALHIFISIGEVLAFIHHGMIYKGGRYQKVAHGEPLVHCDIKEDNIFLRWPQGKTAGGLPDVVLADWGLANLETQTRPGWGCIPFMSPECRYRSVKHLTFKTDIYSFGVMMENILNHASDYSWPMFTDPKDLMIDISFKGCSFTDVLRKCLPSKASDRGDFSGATRASMLWDLLVFREKRSARIRHGEKLKKSYWVANT